MFEGFIDAFKGPKKMSYAHWRFRLLHWCFNVDDPTESPLPRHLYTHFCPLFHLTNIIAIMSPAILFGKIMWAVAVILVEALIKLFNALDVVAKFLFKYVPRIRWKKREKTQDEIDAARAKEREWMKGRERDQLIHNINGASDKELKDLEFFLARHSYDFLNPNEIKEIWTKYVPLVIEARRKKEIAREKLRKRLIFWSNFSRVFFKAALNIFYVVLSVFIVYITAFYLIPWSIKLTWIVGGWIVALLSFDWLWLLKQVGAFSIWVASVLLSVAIGVYIIVKLGVIFKKPLGYCWRKTLPPLRLIEDVISAFGQYIGKVIVGTVEFMVMFYEENCPPIKIVDDQEAIIEEGVE